MTVHIDGAWLKDGKGRTLLLRGVNLGGSSKVPYPNGGTHIREGFFDHRNVSFVGRPFPLEEARRHLERLREWGLTFLRLIITWEAIEHAGPGIYDVEYLDYITEVARLAGEMGFTLFIDPHQDVWSRFTGGDGAPGWTLELAGFDMTHFQETGAAFIHNQHPGRYPRMIWPTNATKLACATMFSLFFGGETFAPDLRVDGVSIQEYLQSHYINAVVQVARRLRDMPHVLGYDSLNEPSNGYIGWGDLRITGGLLRLGATPSPYQAMLLGAGFPQVVDHWRLSILGLRRTGFRLMNTRGVRAWQEGRACIWQAHGVWDVDHAGMPHLLQPNYFAIHHGQRVDFVADHLKPFIRRFADAVRDAHPGAILFIEDVPGQPLPEWGPDDPGNAVNAAHWYEGLTLFRKRFAPWLGVDMRTHRITLGAKKVRRLYSQSLETIAQEARERMNGMPSVIGEIGLPFDLNGRRAYRNGNFSAQRQAMDCNMAALEGALLNFTLWNYTADNSNAHGDQWNEEDFSIFSRDQQTNPEDINSGGRALEAVVRPYAIATPGVPLHMAFDLATGRFEYTFRGGAENGEAVEVFVPRLHYGGGCSVTVSDGAYELDLPAQRLTWRVAPGVGEHRLVLKKG